MPACAVLADPGSALVLAGLQPELQWQYAPIVDSTNTQLLTQAFDLPTGTLLAAELQTAGRGRQGRRWHALPGQSLTFSLLWHFERGIQALMGLSLVVAVALNRAFQRLGISGVALKWPNDLLYAQGKLGGFYWKPGSEGALAVRW